MTFSEAFLTEQREHLRAEKARLEGELTRIAKKDPVVAHDYDAKFPEYGRDEEANAQEEEVYEQRRGVEQSLELHLRDVNEALERVGAGTYGQCTVCGAAIGEARLRANPAAGTCLDHTR